MTIVNHETGEIVEALDEGAAKRLTERIRLIAENVAEQIDKLAALIDEARIGSAWLALGYRSWTAYVAGEFGGVLPRLDREPRQEFVRELAARGMSSRSIAPIVGSSDRQVRRDMDSGGTDVPPASGAAGTHVEDEGGRVSRFESGPSSTSPQGGDEPERTEPASPRPAVTGLDGKRYTAPTPKPRLAPAPDQYTDQDRAEDCARMLARNLSGLYALTSVERRAEFIATWADGTSDLPPLGADFVTPKHMRDLSAALLDFANEWETANV